MTSRILLADDSITIQKVVNLTFADEGIEVIAVSNGEQAERRLTEICPDLVLADIFMPGKNGYELCEFVKQNPQFRNVPVVLLVGAFEPFNEAEARRVRADAHLTKPFESRTLVDTVRKLISMSGRPNTGSLAAASARGQQEAPVLQPVADASPVALPSFNLDLSNDAGMGGAPASTTREFSAGFARPAAGKQRLAARTRLWLLRKSRERA
jgi:CheY-like chemotaxis protein